jgi:two-component system, NarL family, response regulator DegU
MRRITVMIVDSQPFLRAGLRSALSQDDNSQPMEILECDPSADGSAAMSEIASKSPDVVMLDIGYPFLNGLDIGKKIARNFPSTKVVMLSTNPEDDDDELFEVIKIGAVAYLRSRLASPSELVNMIKRAASGEYPINDSVSTRPKVAWRVLRQFQDISSIGEKMEELTAPLSPKEIQILTHIAEGNSNKRVARLLSISEQTVKNHVSAILRKLNANDRAHAVFLALQNGWISAEGKQNGHQWRERVPLP